MFSIPFVIAVVLMLVAKIIIGFLWFSNFLFGKTVSNDFNLVTTGSKLPAIKSAIMFVIQSSIIYFITYNIYFLLPATFFLIIFAIILLVVSSNIYDVIWGRKTSFIYFIYQSENFISLMVAFIISLTIISSL